MHHCSWNDSARNHSRARYSFYLRELDTYTIIVSSKVQHRLRIAGKDIEGTKKIVVALSEIKEVGYNP